MFDLRIRFALDDLLDFKTSRSKMMRYLRGLEKIKIDIHFVLPPIVEVHRFVTDMEGKKQ